MGAGVCHAVTISKSVYLLLVWEGVNRKSQEGIVLAPRCQLQSPWMDENLDERPGALPQLSDNNQLTKSICRQKKVNLHHTFPQLFSHKSSFSNPLRWLCCDRHAETDLHQCLICASSSVENSKNKDTNSTCHILINGLPVGIQCCWCADRVAGTQHFLS